MKSPTVEPTKPTAVEPTKPTSMKATTTTEAAVTGIGHPWLKSGGGKQHDRGGGPESPSNCIAHPPTPPTALMCGFSYVRFFLCVVLRPAGAINSRLAS